MKSQNKYSHYWLHYSMSTKLYDCKLRRLQELCYKNWPYSAAQSFTVLGSINQLRITPEFLFFNPPIHIPLSLRPEQHSCCYSIIMVGMYQNSSRGCVAQCMHGSLFNIRYVCWGLRQRLQASLKHDCLYWRACSIVH